MANFLELQTAVQELTTRPDKPVLIAEKINATIRLISASGMFWRDVLEVTLTDVDGVDPAANVQNIPLPASFRHPVYLSYPEDISECPIEVIPFKTIINPDYRNKSDIAYCSGSNLIIRNQTETPTLNMGYFTFQPDLVLDDDTNWITEFLSPLVIDLASSYVAAITGDTDRSKSISSIFNAQLNIYIQDLVKSSVPGI